MPLKKNNLYQSFINVLYRGTWVPRLEISSLYEYFLTLPTYKLTFSFDNELLKEVRKVNGKEKKVHKTPIHFVLEPVQYCLEL